MKNATIPSLRLGNEQRRTQSEFIAHGLSSRDDARRSGEYFSSNSVHKELNCMLATAKKKTKAG